MGLKANRVVLVTGASRGIGRGVALALAAPGTTVYITGRTTQAGTAALPGTIHDAAAEVTRRGGKGIAVACDHADDAAVAALFAQIRRDSGRLDLLVNNATAIPDELVLPGGLLGEAAVDAGDPGCRLPLPLRRQLARRAADGGPARGAHRDGLLPGGALLPARAGLRGRQGGHRQDVRGHVGGPQEAQCRDRVPVGRDHPHRALRDRHQGTPGRVRRGDGERGASGVPRARARCPDEGPEACRACRQTFYAAELARQLDVRDVDGRQPPSDAAFLGEPAQVSGAVIGG